MEKQLFYPAIFEETEENQFTIVFPDLEGCITAAQGIEESYKMAAEVLGMTLVYFGEEKRPIPPPSKLADIELKDNQFVALIEFDLLEYRKKYESKSVSKNCTIPSWLNELALRERVNFSQLLQDALMQKLNVT